MKKIAITLCFLLIPVIGCSKPSPTSTVPPKVSLQDEVTTKLLPTREAKWPLLVGKWFGSMSTKGGGKYMWIADRKNDGSYKIHFRVVEPSGKKNIDKIEVGEWGVSGNIYFTIYKADIEGGKTIPVDPTVPANRDAYKIRNLTNEVFEYEHLDNGVRFSVRKVAEDFVFPE